MRSFLAGWLPLAVAIAFVACLYSLRSHLTRSGTWKRVVTWPLPLVAFFPLWLGGTALVLSLIGGDIWEVHHFEGSRGPVVWQERGVTMLHMDTGPDLERQWFEIKDANTGKLLAKVDYVKWLAAQTDTIEVLGASGDTVWLVGEKLGLHTRDLYTGKHLKGREQLLGNIALAERPFHFNADTHTLEVKAKDGRTIELK
ncbi:MAG TPA: hypothetical protein VIV40_23035 [Kofleriaceae bacterium]